MKRALLGALILLLFTAPAIAEDDDKRQAMPVPVLGLEAPVLPSVPSVLEMPGHASGVVLGCWNQRIYERRSIAQYTLIVGVAAELPVDVNLGIAGATVALDYGFCKIKQRRQRKALERQAYPAETAFIRQR